MNDRLYIHVCMYGAMYISLILKLQIYEVGFFFVCRFARYRVMKNSSGIVKKR